jgi:hypothetical protein
MYEQARTMLFWVEVRRDPVIGLARGFFIYANVFVLSGDLYRQSN